MTQDSVRDTFGGIGLMGPSACILFDGKSSSSAEVERSQSHPSSLRKAAEHPQKKRHEALKCCKFSLLLTGHSLPSVQKPYRKQKKTEQRFRRRGCISYFLSSLLSLCLSTLRQVKIQVTSNSSSVHRQVFLQSIWPEQQAKQTGSTLIVLQLNTQANKKAEMSLSEKSQHKQKKSLGNNILVSSKYRTTVFFLLFLELKYAWKTKGQTTKGLKDSDLTVLTKKKHSAKEREESK